MSRLHRRRDVFSCECATYALPLCHPMRAMRLRRGAQQRRDVCRYSREEQGSGRHRSRHLKPCMCRGERKRLANNSPKRGHSAQLQVRCAQRWTRQRIWILQQHPPPHRHLQVTHRRSVSATYLSIRVWALPAKVRRHVHPATQRHQLCVRNNSIRPYACPTDHTLCCGVADERVQQSVMCQPSEQNVL